jgi:hypothetical protein
MWREATKCYSRLCLWAYSYHCNTNFGYSHTETYALSITSILRGSCIVCGRVRFSAFWNAGRPNEFVKESNNWGNRGAGSVYHRLFFRASHGALESGRRRFSPRESAQLRRSSKTLFASFSCDLIRPRISPAGKFLARSSGQSHLMRLPGKVRTLTKPPLGHFEIFGEPQYMHDTMISGCRKPHPK